MDEQQVAFSTAGSLFVRRVTAMRDFEFFLDELGKFITLDDRGRTGRHGLTATTDQRR